MGKRAVTCITALAFITTSCAQYAKESDLDCIKIGMKKEKAMDGMSARGYMRGSLLNKWGDVIEVREYEVEKGNNTAYFVAAGILTICSFGILLPLFFIPPAPDTYWLYFSNDRLVQWGKAGDWKEAERIVWDLNVNINKA